jgi:iron complex transport system substrate-binding protein
MAARSSIVIVCLGLCLAVSLAAQTQPPAKRIISLVPALTEILFAIGAGPQVIAVSSFDDDPPEVLKLPRVGALLDPDTERILSMRPDLVLTYGSQTDLDKQLAAAGIRTFSYRHGGLADVTPTFHALGKITGHVEEASRAAASIEARLEAIRSRVAGRPRPRTLLVMGRTPRSLRQLHASGGIGFLNDVITLAGGANVFADIKRQAVQASTEMLIARAPDIILDLHYSREMKPGEIEAERDVWQTLPSIPAVKSKRVHIMLGDHLVVPGPRIAAAAEEYAHAIHPAAFQQPRKHEQHENTVSCISCLSWFGMWR